MYALVTVWTVCFVWLQLYRMGGWEPHEGTILPTCSWRLSWINLYAAFILAAYPAWLHCAPGSRSSTQKVVSIHVEKPAGQTCSRAYHKSLVTLPVKRMMDEAIHRRLMDVRTAKNTAGHILSFHGSISGIFTGESTGDNFSSPYEYVRTRRTANDILLTRKLFILTSYWISPCRPRTDFNMVSATKHFLRTSYVNWWWDMEPVSWILVTCGGIVDWLCLGIECRIYILEQYCNCI